MNSLPSLEAGIQVTARITIDARMVITFQRITQAITGR